MKAIISDVHSNLEALRAVLSDIDAQGVDDILCLGDVIGYGPDPRDCLDLIMNRCRITMLGNHDEAALFDPKSFNPYAERVIFWTRAQLELPGEARALQERRWEYLAEMPRLHKEDGFTYVHASPRNPTSEYVFPEDVYDQRKMTKIFSMIERGCFMGHTHVPGVITEDGQYFHPEDLGGEHKLDERKVLCNVGSVGQPRDNDRRACYVVFDGETIRFRRVPYNYDVTRKKIQSVPELRGGRDWLGDGGMDAGPPVGPVV
ncbi:MAG TPA: metallophosphoesterase family protein [Gemmataceae bacterium]|nr:metallophosphoesterase family protein [Gemmataceae bacterium]